MATFNSAGSGNANADATWTESGQPAAGDHAIIASGHTVTLTATEAWGSVGIVSGGTLAGGGQTLTLNDGGQGTIFDNDGEVSGTLNVTITGTTNRYIDLAGTGSVNNLIINASSTTFNLAGGGTHTLAGNLTVTAGTLGTGNDCALTVTGDCVVGSGTAVLTLNNSTVALGALKIDSSTATVTATSSGTLNITTGSVFGASTNYSIFNNAGHLNHAGTMTISGGTYWDIIGATSTVNDVIFADTYRYVGAVTIGGDLTVNASYTFGTYGGTQTLIVNGNVLVNGILDLASGPPVSADATFGSLTIASGGEYRAATSGTTTINGDDSGSAWANLETDGTGFVHNNGLVHFN